MYHFIDDSVMIDFKVPKFLRSLMDSAEEADQNNDYGNYMVYADGIDVMAKNCCAEGILTKRQWDILCSRYVQ